MGITQLKIRKHMRRQFIEAETRITNEHILKSTISLGFKNIPVNTTISYNFHL